MSLKTEKEHFLRVEAGATRVQTLYYRIVRDFARQSAGTTAPFVWKMNPTLEKMLDELIKEFRTDLDQELKLAIEQEWIQAVQVNDEYIKRLAKKTTISPEKLLLYNSRNLEALSAFQGRKVGNKTLSKRIWNLTKDLKREFEMTLDLGLADGRSADALSRDIRRFLNRPNDLYRRVRNDSGRLIQSQSSMKRIKSEGITYGRGYYRSSYKNAMRVTRTEINNAYRMSDYHKRQQLDFVVGIEVKRSNHKYDCAVCEALKGKYPKDFVFTSWHPHCYDKETEVYTKNGWKLFKDVLDEDLILSLNPNTRNVEWSGIVEQFKYNHKGEMINFKNNSLDLMVTPDHKMVYLSWDGKAIKQERLADDFDYNKGALYRGCEYDFKEKKEFTIGDITLPFNVYAEFMGFYLSEGSTSRKYRVCIAQSKEKNPQTYSEIDKTLSKLGVKYSKSDSVFSIYNKSIYEYVEQFGKSHEKYIPIEIKESGKDNLKSFLRTFNLGDGSRRKPKEFKGNRGGIGKSKPEVLYYTSSKQMADDLGELILKSGKRPSFKIQKAKGVTFKHKNGDYVSNYDMTVIRECRSKTATVFSKEYIDYDDMVYDVHLEKNHILWVRRNGKVVWGSNCRCFSLSILATDSEFIAQQKALLDGKRILMRSKNEVKSVPNGYKEWLEENKERIESAKSRGTLPHWMHDNGKFL